MDAHKHYRKKRERARMAAHHARSSSRRDDSASSRDTLRLHVRWLDRRPICLRSASRTGCHSGAGGGDPVKRAIASRSTASSVSASPARECRSLSISRCSSKSGGARAEITIGNRVATRSGRKPIATAAIGPQITSMRPSIAAPRAQMATSVVARADRISGWRRIRVPTVSPSSNAAASVSAIGRATSGMSALDSCADRSHRHSCPSPRRCRSQTLKERSSRGRRGQPYT